MWRCPPSGSVPATFEDFEARYHRLVTYSIRRISQGHVSPEDLEDLRQMVYTRIWECDYLTRCRQLLAERGGSFTTYVWWLVRSVCVNQFARNARDPLNLAMHLLDPRDVRRRGAPPPDSLNLEREPRGCDRTFEDRLLSRDTLLRLHEAVRSTRRGARLARTLTLFYEGYTTPEIAAMTRSKMQSRVIRDRREIRKTLRTLTRKVS